MDPRIKIAYFVLDLVAPVTVGYLLGRSGRLSRKTPDYMMTFGIVVLAPLLLLTTMWGARLDVRMIWLPVLGIAMQIIPGLIGFLRSRRKYDHPSEQGSFVLATMLSNRGTVGTLSVVILYQETGYVWARLVMFFAPFVMYLFCYPLAQRFHQIGRRQQGERPKLRTLLLSRNQIPLLGLAAGLALNLAGTPRPEILGSLFMVWVHVMAWVFIVPFGFLIEPAQIRRYWTGTLELLGIKFFLTPAVIYLLGYAVGMRGAMLNTVTILAASPTAVMAVVAARLNRINMHLAMTAVVLTTLVYIVIVFPVILFVFGAGP